MRVGRNDACPCGSGRKYKACCEGKQGRGPSRGLILLLATIGVVAALGVVASIRDKDTQSAVSLPSPTGNARTTPRAQPPGPAPAGKVWSAEHGHWHDAAPQRGTAQRGTAPGGGSPIQVSGATVPNPRGAAPTQRFTPKPQPPGPVPAGKVWSAEHGHWHDARTP